MRNIDKKSYFCISYARIGGKLHLRYVKLNNTIYHLILTLVPYLVLSGCLDTEYYDVATDEIITPEGITNVIPQEGAALEIELTYEFEHCTSTLWGV